MTKPIDLNAYQPVCYVCNRIGPAYDTAEQSEEAATWHIFDAHPDVWMDKVGEAREPNFPRPTPLGGVPGRRPNDKRAN